MNVGTQNRFTNLCSQIDGNLDQLQSHDHESMALYFKLTANHAKGQSTNATNITKCGTLKLYTANALHPKYRYKIEGNFI